MKKLILSLFCGALGFSYAQEKDANILGSVEIGGSRYYVLQETGNGKYYKSELTSIATLEYGDPVKVDQRQDLDGLYQIKDVSLNNLFRAKEESSTTSTDPNAVDPAILYRLPRVYRGMLVFENKQHFDELYNSIESYLEDKKVIPGKKEALSLVEAQIDNYISFREYFESKYPGEEVFADGYTDEEIEQIEKEDFMHDEIIKFFMNQYRMVIIGEDTYYYHDFYSSLKYDVALLDDLQTETERIAWAPNFDLIQGGSFLPFREDVEVLSKKYFVGKNMAKDLKPSTDPKKPKFNITTTYVFHYPTDPCDYQQIGFQVLTFIDGEPLQLGNVNQADLVVNWPGATSSYGPYNIPYIPYHNQVVIHPDLFPGEKTISYSLNFNYNGENYDFKDGFPTWLYPNQHVLGYTISNGVCTEMDDSKGAWKEQSGWKMYAEIWVKNNWTGNKVGSLTHSYKKKSNGKWVRKIAHIEAEIDANLRNGDCEWAQTVSDNDIENQERVDIVKNKLFHKYQSLTNIDINSHHYLSKDGVTITNYLEINGEGCE